MCRGFDLNQCRDCNFRCTASAEPASLRPSASADILPRPIRIAACRAAHLLRPPVDIDRVRVITAVGDARAYRAGSERFRRSGRCPDRATAAIRRIGRAPAHRTRLPAQAAVALVEALADLTADDAANHGAGNRRKRSALLALADLIADARRRQRCRGRDRCRCDQCRPGRCCIQQARRPHERYRKARDAHG